MKQLKLLAIVALILATVSRAEFDRIFDATPISAANGAVKVSGDGLSTAGFQITGTWSGTITFESTIDDANWVSVNATNRATAASSSTTTANGVFNVPTAGVKSVRARMSSYTSGTASITTIISSGTLSGASGGGAGDASASNQTSGAQKTQIVDGSGNVIASTSNNLNVQCANCSGSGASAADEASFTAGSSSFAPSGLFYQTTATNNALTTGQQGMIQGTAQRAAFVNPRNSSGTEIGTSGAPFRVDPTGTTTQPVSYATTGSGTATGALRVELPTNGTGVVGLNAGSNVIGSLTANQSVNVAQINGVTTLMGNGVTGTGSQRVTIASDNTAFTVNAAQATASSLNAQVVGSVAHDGVGTSTNPLAEGGYASAAAPTDVSADGDIVRGWNLRNGARAVQPTYAGILQSTGNGTAGTGTPRVTIASDNTAFSVNAVQSGTWTVQPGNTANTTGWFVAGGAATDAAVTGNPLLAGGRASTATPTAMSADGDAVPEWLDRSGATVVTGYVAHDAAVGGNPILNGFEARTSDVTAVANGDAVRAQATIDGKQVTMPYSVRATRWSYAAASGGIVNTTGVTIAAAAGAGLRNCITAIDIENGHATVSTEVVVRDGAAGTVIKRWWAQAAGGGISRPIPSPICGTANTLLEVAAITTGSAIYVNAEGYTSQE